jgi:hypothetical protein
MQSRVAGPSALIIAKKFTRSMSPLAAIRAGTVI